MKPESNKNKTFRVELGINHYAAPVPQTNPNLRVFPLQNALIEFGESAEDYKPAWYSRLGIGDEISFRLVDISSLRVPSHEPDYPGLGIAELYFCNPLTGETAHPFTQRIAEWSLSERLEDQVSPVYSLNPEHRLPTRNIIAHTFGGQEQSSLTFSDFDPLEGNEQPFRAFELTVALKMKVDGWTNHYVFDPEMIVSETDNEGDGSSGRSAPHTKG